MTTEPRPGRVVDFVGHKGLHRLRLKRRTGGWDIELGIGFDGRRRNEITAVFKKLDEVDRLHRELGAMLAEAREEQERQRWVRPEDRN